jgi:hypothetical protein
MSSLSKMADYIRYLNYQLEIWKGWASHYAKAIFSAFAGRTATGPRFNEDPTPSKCGHPDISSRHIIEQCPLFDQRRQKIWNGHAAPPNLPIDMLLDKEWGSRVRDFAKKTGLGFRSELIWNSERTEKEMKINPSRNEPSLASQ